MRGDTKTAGIDRLLGPARGQPVTGGWSGSWMFVVGAILLWGLGGCQGTDSAVFPGRGPYRVVRFVELDDAGGRPAVISRDGQGSVFVSQGGVTASHEGSLWLLARGKVVRLGSDGRAHQAKVCSGASELLLVGRHLLVTCPNDDALLVFEADSLSPMQRIDVCTGPQGLASLPSGRLVYVGCDHGLALVAGGGAGLADPQVESLVLWSGDADGLTALSEEGLFRWRYPGLHSVPSWQTFGFDGRSVVGVGRVLTTTGKLEVQGDSETRAELVFVILSFGESLDDVRGGEISLEVRNLGRAGVGQPCWDGARGALLVPLPAVGEVLSFSPQCLLSGQDDSMVRTGCGFQGAVRGQAAAVLPSGVWDGKDDRVPLVWDGRDARLWALKGRDAELVWSMDDRQGE